MPGTNTLAYLALSSVSKENSFITLTSGVNIIKTISFVTDEEAKQARVFVPKVFVSKAGAYWIVPLIEKGRLA